MAAVVSSSGQAVLPITWFNQGVKMHLELAVVHT